MPKEKTVDNIGFLSHISLAKFPNVLLMAHEVDFVSPFKKTGKPAQAEEFWLETDEHSLFFSRVKEDIFYNTKIGELIKINYPLSSYSFFSGSTLEYFGVATYISYNETKKYNIKCTFYIRRALEAVDVGLNFVVDREFRVEVDLYDDWGKDKDEEETNRFDLMEID